MADVMMKDLIERIERLEQRVDKMSPTPSLGSGPGPGDWQSVVGIFGDSDFQRKVDAEIQAMRDAEWQRIQNGEPE